MDADVPWVVTWTEEFEDAVTDLKQSGRWQQVERRIRKIIENPARTGKYKDGSLKEIRTTHLGEKIIGWRVIPGVPSDLQDRVEKVILLFIVHHDEQGFGFTNTNTVTHSDAYTVELPYYGGFEMGRKINEIFRQAKQLEGFRVKEPDWQDEYVEISGQIPSEYREKLESILPESATVEYEESGLLD